MRFAVLSYNILHSFGASRLQRLSRAHGPWAHERLHRVAQLILARQPDVVCLQEVDATGLAELERALGGQGYTLAGELRNESLPPQDGCATFVRGGCFDVAAVHPFRLRDRLSCFLPGLDAPGMGLALALRREVHEKLNLAVAVQLRPRGRGTGFWVATTHLYWNPKYPDLKLLQAFMLSRELEAIAGGDPVVLAGDFNSTPQSAAGDASGVYALLTSGFVDPVHSDHPVSVRRASGILQGVSTSHVPRLEVTPFKSAYLEALGMEGPVTNASREFVGCLDYIFHRPGKDTGLRLVEVEPLPSESSLRPQLPLPSAEHPSDHLPLQATFDLLE